MAIHTVEVWTEHKGWVTVSVERDNDRAVQEAMRQRDRLGPDVRINVRREDGEITWLSR